ncbi:hypothetical protein HK099_005257 [Clydaea vesicula]|uniref:Phosphorylase b kinase regulatory subunit n=1 Tax=Clydaea vesicula TaxID=447962 RepID=A0AAD5U857_9FUNG|nr:hypothetical protein HK099_005257 [Clydaea vesicula]KAJ3396950.1 hypothetical protein HDU92_001241 [Lobulomyces angularis]
MGVRSTLDCYFKEVRSIILSKQNPATGLIPASVAITTHGNYTDAWVRDNVYSIMAPWALSLAYKRIDDDLGRAYELENATIKCMRGLLTSMIKQSAKVEKFKNTQRVEDALHAKYNTATGATVVGDNEWGHLQIDATSIFLLMLAQMTASGLSIIYTLDEVNFVQNLVFYIERAYRTPDYGIWERGNKINRGTPELNSSSIGMAVAALQAINGLNLFGARGGPSSVIHVLPDEMIRNYTTLHSALPRESYSKEVDAALLSVISFPAFALHDVELINKTRSEIIRKLEGNYGCKRFLRDGHQCILEDTNRLHYEPSELKIFEDIECEWPLFFTYLVLDGLFFDNKEQVKTYVDKLAPLSVDSSNIPQYSRSLQSELTDSSASSGKTFTRKNLPPDHMTLVPELYIVPSENVEAEKKNPRSQKRVPNENVPLVWAQSLKIVGNLINEQLIDTADLDPLGKRFLPYMHKKGSDVVVQLVLLAEDQNLQAKMAMSGLETQTIDSCAPITISSPSALRDAFSTLGENSKLGLTGRPGRPIGTLSTCRLYRCKGRLYSFLPHFMDREESYLVSDNNYLISLLEQELTFIKNNWVGTGRPTLCILLTNDMLKFRTNSETNRRRHTPTNTDKRGILDFMMQARTGSVGGVRVKLGRLGDMVNTACIESLDFLVSTDNGDVEDWHSVLKSDKINIGFGKTLELDTKDTNVYSRSSTPNRSSSGKPKRSASIHQKKKGSEYNSVSGLMSPISPTLSTPFFSDLDFKLNDHVERSVLNPARSITNSPTHDSPSRNINGSEYVAEPMDVMSLEASPASVLFSSKAGIQTTNKAEAENGDVLLSLTLGDHSNLDNAINTLRCSTNLYDQIDILHYIYSCKGPDYHIPNLDTVSTLLEEVYMKGMYLKRWSVVRQAAGLLRKAITNLSLNLSDLLIRRKPITIGFGESECFISGPLSPAALLELIYKHCTSDVREAPLVMEILAYLAEFIRSNSELLDGIMRIRTHMFIIALREEISRIKGCDEEEAVEELMQMSPFELKSLCGQVLNSADYCNATNDPAESTFSTAARWKQIHLQNAGHTQSIGLPNQLTIRAQSAGHNTGNFAKIEVLKDGKMQDVTISVGRGLNVIIFDPLDGEIVETATFDSHSSSEESDEFANMIEWLDTGMIVVVVSKDDCTENITESAKFSCEILGSKSIREVKYRDSWCLIGEKVANGEGKEAISSSTSGKPTELIEVCFDLSARRKQAFDNLPVKANTMEKDLNLAAINLFLPSHGRWLRKRKNDGALNRVPPGFYPNVWQVLSLCEGILIGKRFLPRDPTISEKTSEEISFGMLFESLLDVIRDPAERQMVTECLVVISNIYKNNPEAEINGGCLDILSIIREATRNYWNHWVKAGNIEVKELNGNNAVADASELQSPPPTPGKTIKNALGMINTNFEDNEVFARRLFFDLSQHSKEGSIAHLADAASNIFFKSSVDLKVEYQVIA